MYFVDVVASTRYSNRSLPGYGDRVPRSFVGIEKRRQQPNEVKRETVGRLVLPKSERQRKENRRENEREKDEGTRRLAFRSWCATLGGRTKGKNL